MYSEETRPKPWLDQGEEEETGQTRGCQTAPQETADTDPSAFHDNGECPIAKEQSG